jgi:hypothetical protein
MVCGVRTVGLRLDTNNVWPSGVDRTTEPAAMVPLAPALISIMTDVFKASLKCGAIKRATMSLEPPAGKPTTSVMGLAEKSCAVALGKTGSVLAEISASAQSFKANEGIGCLRRIFF